MSSDMDLGDLDNSEDGGEALIYKVIDFCGGPDLIEVFGPSGSGKSVFSLEVLKSAMKDADKNCLFIDAERNVGSMEGLEGMDYVYIPEWHDLYNYITRKNSKVNSDMFGENNTGSNVLEDGYDVVVFDSIGFPALVQYADYRVQDNADQFKVFLEIQHITGKLKQYAQRNDSLVIVTNQPKSDLSSESDPAPFGDKSIFGFKEVWRTNKVSSNATATRCRIDAWRSRQAGAGKSIFEMKIDDSGVDITQPDEEEAGGWM